MFQLAQLVCMLVELLSQAVVFSDQHLDFMLHFVRLIVFCIECSLHSFNLHTYEGYLILVLFNPKPILALIGISLLQVDIFSRQKINSVLQGSDICKFQFKYTIQTLNLVGELLNNVLVLINLLG